MHFVQNILSGIELKAKLPLNFLLLTVIFPELIYPVYSTKKCQKTWKRSLKWFTITTNNVFVVFEYIIEIYRHKLKFVLFKKVPIVVIY